MPRQSRIDSPGVLYHVIGRGISRQKMFTGKEDYLLFMKRLGDLLVQTQISCFAWVLIFNHFHLLLGTGNVPNIHLNPLRAKLVLEHGSLTGYPYCGHGVLMGRRKIAWQDKKYVLRLIGKKSLTARNEYSRFVRVGIEQWNRTDLTGGGLLRSPGVGAKSGHCEKPATIKKATSGYWEMEFL